ncbi:MAG: aminotransferase class III-fold pyridoxal phosphate-dependent enzyme [Polyangiaceae bacterium]|nr:aminotransferase class III-fold pyridoxal phosphate-dependent enzyme [Polyangiaceae bacterium]
MARSAPPIVSQDPPLLLVPPPGPRSRAQAARLQRVECPGFGHRRKLRAEAAGTPAGESEADGPIVLARGAGANLWDVDDNRYVDLVAGFGAVALGHGALDAVLARQGARLVQGLGDVYATDVKLELLERLARLHPSGAGQVLLGQSGADAVTAALKTALLATGRPGVLAFDGAYHGLSYAPLAACGFRASFREPFQAQLSPHVRFAPYPGLRGASVAAALALVEQALRAGDIGAVLCEPVLGRGGCVVPPGHFLGELCRLAHAHGALVVADEIWTGMGRAGAVSLALTQQAPVDILCFGKALGAGLPISACVASEAVMEAWTRHGEVVHTSTHVGAPLACAAALALLDWLDGPGRLEDLRARGAEARARLRQLLAGAPGFVEVRGSGLMLGVELDGAGSAVRAARALVGRGYLALAGGLAGEVLTLTPPFDLSPVLFEGFGVALGASLEAAAARGAR